MSRKITTLKILVAITAAFLLFVCILSMTGNHLKVYMPGDIIYASPELDGGPVAGRITFRIEPNTK